MIVSFRSSQSVELCFGGRGSGRRQVGFGAREVFEVFEEDFNPGEVVGYCLVELIWELMDPGAPEGHRRYCWFVGHFVVSCGQLYLVKIVEGNVESV
jgi:hypothetical protein